jgi:hypothetical protein
MSYPAVRERSQAAKAVVEGTRHGTYGTNGAGRLQLSADRANRSAPNAETDSSVEAPARQRVLDDGCSSDADCPSAQIGRVALDTQVGVELAFNNHAQ